MKREPTAPNRPPAQDKSQGASPERAKIQKHFAPFWPAVQADVVRLYGQYSLGRLVWSILKVRTFRPIFTMRLCQAASGLPTPLRGLTTFPCRVLHSLAQQLAAMDVNWDTNIGPGVLILHGWGTCLAPPGVTIGSNLTLFHGVTIGQQHKISASGRVKSFPTIEDEVWIGPMAVITGGVVIGRGARIAPGTVVTGDVEPYSIVGGNPMRVIRTDALPDVINPA